MHACVYLHSFIVVSHRTEFSTYTSAARAVAAKDARGELDAGRPAPHPYGSVPMRILSTTAAHGRCMPQCIQLRSWESVLPSPTSLDITPCITQVARAACKHHTATTPHAPYQMRTRRRRKSASYAYEVEHRRLSPRWVRVDRTAVVCGRGHAIGTSEWRGASVLWCEHVLPI